MSLCKTCLPLVEAAKLVESNGVIPLKHLFCSQFQSKGYKSDKAIRRFMQLPIVILKVKGTLHVLEYSSNIEYERLQELIDKLIPEQKLTLGLNREALQALCNLASTEADRKLIRVATTAGMSASQAETSYGISNLHKERGKVAQAIKEYTAIRSAVDELVRAKEKAVLESFGVTEASDSEEEIIDSDGDDAFIDNEKKTAGTDRSGNESIEADTCECDGFIEINRDVVQENANINLLLSQEHLLMILRGNMYNWFSFIAELEINYPNLTKEGLEQMLRAFVHYLSDTDLNSEETKLWQQSRQAYLTTRSQAISEEQHRVGEVWTDSESDDPEDWVELTTRDRLKSPAFQEKIKKKKAAFARLKKRMMAKEVTRKALLKRKVPKSVNKTLRKFPNIGKDIEAFAKENRIGADAWRRTGVLTFSGNLKRGPKITYNRIKQHLEKKYGTKIGYGTIVQLCLVHNKRRLSARRYWGIAGLKSRRARKGFNVRLNIDSHWSCAFYKCLDYIQRKDGEDKVILNRDDAAGFRLDTTYTHKQHKILAEASNPELTTRTDYVNKYASVLQTTSYLFMGTENTAETCVGVVKAHQVFPKNPAQHAADFELLYDHPDIQPLLQNKDVDCIRVDGASDEGPSHFEVQFMWTEWHYNCNVEV